MNDSFSKNTIEKRKKEIIKVNKIYKFKKYFNLNLPTAELDKIGKKEIIEKISKCFSEINPQIVYMPFRDDIHSDHKIIADATMSVCKWFRLKKLEKLLMYETLSETNFNYIDRFKPNTFIDISKYIEKKLQIMKIYKSELGSHPFPRSIDSIKSLSKLRGSESGFEYAEGFKLIFNFIK